MASGCRDLERNLSRDTWPAPDAEGRWKCRAGYSGRCPRLHVQTAVWPPPALIICTGITGDVGTGLRKAFEKAQLLTSSERSRQGCAQEVAEEEEEEEEKEKEAQERELCLFL